MSAQADEWLIDFEDIDLAGTANDVNFGHGTVVANQYANGIPIVADGTQTNMGYVHTGPLTSFGVTILGENNTNGVDLAVAFDSHEHPTADGDLEDPFNSNNPNLPDGFRPGHILIIQEHNYSGNCNDGTCDTPDDEGTRLRNPVRETGWFEFDFGAEVDLVSIDFFDIENDAPINDENGQTDGNEILVEYNNSGTWSTINEWTPGTGGDNTYDQVTFNLSQSITGLRVELAGSGAIDNIRGTIRDTTTVPEPSALAAFGTGLLALGLLWRRQRIAA